jgi:hypothetical protein
MKIRRSVSLTYGSGSGFYSCNIDLLLFLGFFCLLLFEDTVHLHQSSETKSQKEVTKQRKPRLSFFCLIMEGSGSRIEAGSVKIMTDPDPRGPKNVRILRIRIHHTGRMFSVKDNIHHLFVPRNECYVTSSYGVLETNKNNFGLNRKEPKLNLFRLFSVCFTKQKNNF